MAQWVKDQHHHWCGTGLFAGHELSRIHMLQMQPKKKKKVGVETKINQISFVHIKMSVRYANENVYLALTIHTILELKESFRLEI